MVSLVSLKCIKNHRELRVCSEFDNGVYSRYEALVELLLLLRGPQKLLNIPTNSILDRIKRIQPIYIYANFYHRLVGLASGPEHHV
jgi:hypothetical protein